MAGAAQVERRISRESCQVIEAKDLMRKSGYTRLIAMTVSLVRTKLSAGAFPLRVASHHGFPQRSYTDSCAQKVVIHQ